MLMGLSNGSMDPVILCYPFFFSPVFSFSLCLFFHVSQSEALRVQEPSQGPVNLVRTRGKKNRWNGITESGVCRGN